MSAATTDTSLQVSHVQLTPTLEDRIVALENATPKHDFDEDYRLKLYETYRNRIQHEDTLLNQRINFMLGSQAILLAPYIISYTATVDKATDQKALQALQNLQFTVPYIGLGSCLIALTGAIGAAYAISKAKQDYDTVCSTNPHLKMPVTMPGIHSNRVIHTMGLIPPFGFIGLLFTVWASFISKVDTFKENVALMLQWSPFVLGGVALLIAGILIGRYFKSKQKA